MRKTPPSLEPRRRRPRQLYFTHTLPYNSSQVYSPCNSFDELIVLGHNTEPTVQFHALPFSGHTYATAGFGSYSKAKHTDHCEEGLVCMLCLKPDVTDVNSNGILICSNCADPYHMACMQPRVNAVPEGHWFCGNCGGNATCYRGPTTGGINVGLPAWPQAVEIHLCNHLAVDNQLFQYSSPYNNEKPWKYLPRNKQKGRFSVNTDHSCSRACNAKEQYAAKKYAPHRRDQRMF